MNGDFLIADMSQQFESRYDDREHRVGCRLR